MRGGGDFPQPGGRRVSVIARIILLSPRNFIGSTIKKIISGILFSTQKTMRGAAAGTIDPRQGSSAGPTRFMIGTSLAGIHPRYRRRDSVSRHLIKTRTRPSTSHQLRLIIFVFSRDAEGQLKMFKHSISRTAVTLPETGVPLTSLQNSGNRSVAPKQ